MISRYLKNIALFFMCFFGVLNRFLPKFNLIVFFTNNSESNDNNRALLKQFVELGLEEKYKIYFFSKDGGKYRHFDSVKYRNIFLAPMYFLFSRYCFYDCGTLKIKPSSEQKVISLWHGVPLKKIGLMADERSSSMDRYNDFTKIVVPHNSWVDIYKKSFGCSDEQILINGFPRNDFLFDADFDSLSKLGISSDFKRKILWMPTFRRSIGGRYVDSSIGDEGWDLPLFYNIDDLIFFDSMLDGKGVCLVIKLHPYSVLNSREFVTFKNIHFIKNSELNRLGVINYQFVSCFDSLITDYSSILFDYILLNRPMAFTIDDIADYSGGRGFSVNDPESYLVGDKISDSNELLDFITGGSISDAFANQRELLQERVHQFNDGFSTRRLIQFLGL